MDWAAIDDNSNEYDGEDESSEGEEGLFKATDYYFNSLTNKSNRMSGSKEEDHTLCIFHKSFIFFL